MKIYFVKLALRGVSPMIWRRIKIPGETSLAQLHHVIQMLFAWDNYYLHQFHIYGIDYGLSRLCEISFADDARQVFLDDFEFDVGDKFKYEYSFYANWTIDIRIEKIKERSQTEPIYCLRGNGMIGFNRYDELEPTLNLLKAVSNADEKTTFGDIYSYVNALNLVRFNRNQINTSLK